MRAAEQATGASEWELMQRAGRGCAEWVWRIAAGRAVTVLCGPGNNGGDGYVIAEVLRARGLDVAVVAPQPPASTSAQRAAGCYRGPVQKALGKRHAAVLVDALFGFGLSRAVAGVFAKLLEEAIVTNSYIIAIDVPSGVESDTGAWLGTPFDSDLTLALGAWKRAQWLMPASAAMGEKRLVDIGVRAAVESDRVAPRPRLSVPTRDSHKYRRGLLAIVAGAMPGAPLLAAQAALRAGAGYVKLLSAHPHPDAPAELVIDRDPLEGELADARIGAALIGPGLGRDDNSRERLSAVLDTSKPVVLDADALHLLDWDALEGVAPHRLLLTPHEGELAALCQAFGVTAESKLERVVGLRDATGANVLAKGPDTLLAPAGGGLMFFPAASSWLSAAGTGDVLAGIAASRLAHHGDPAKSAVEAVWLHREAARIAGPAFTGGELAHAVGPALAAFL
ncbi:MAG: NAD(P)H-hydrate epimerase [Qipengyuania sp.]|jgi:ADP-dependent NAD(P)H-hydrate dehydratase / NAD(P)H-hydrate epimerase|nr:NAD(P)H-hydrate epimerase [Qipengyuania sp.]